MNRCSSGTKISGDPSADEVIGEFGRTVRGFDFLEQTKSDSARLRLRRYRPGVGQDASAEVRNPAEGQKEDRVVKWEADEWEMAAVKDPGEGVAAWRAHKLCCGGNYGAEGWSLSKGSSGIDRESEFRSDLARRSKQHANIMFNI
jgi:hypothetical protein